MLLVGSMMVNVRELGLVSVASFKNRTSEASTLGFKQLVHSHSKKFSRKKGLRWRYGGRKIAPRHDSWPDAAVVESPSVRELSNGACMTMRWRNAIAH